MRRLPENTKRRIVEHLACFRTHAEVVELIADEFDVDLTSRHVRAYDPMSFQFAGGAKWREYHGLVRKRFEVEVGQIPIAHQTLRLRRLGQLHDAAFGRAMAAEDPAAFVELSKEARSLLEQAAKEVGNVYTNIQKAAGVMAHVHVPVERTPEEKRIMLAERLKEAMERMAREKREGERQKAISGPDASP